MKRVVSRDPTRRSCRIGELIALMSLALSPGSPAHAALADGIAFEGARLGMSQAEWRALPAPGKLSPHTKPVCSNDPDAAGLTLTDAERSAGGVVCAYVDAWGKLSLPVSFTFDQKYQLDHLRYWFADDRLTQIRAGVSLDGFDALTGDFTRLYGACRLVRDRVKTEVGLLPRVTETWSTLQGSIELVDPTLPNDEIGLRFATTGAPTAPHTLKGISR
jgi:hypothetical protein